MIVFYNYCQTRGSEVRVFLWAVHIHRFKIMSLSKMWPQWITCVPFRIITVRNVIWNARRIIWPSCHLLPVCGPCGEGGIDRNAFLIMGQTHSRAVQS